MKLKWVFFFFLFSCTNPIMEQARPEKPIKEETPTLTIPAALTYTVIFESNGGSTVEDQIVTEGEKATRPDNPAKDGYIFHNWYANTRLTAAFDFNTSITANTIVYARWNIVSPMGFHLMQIPAGTFMMGSPTTELDRDDDETQHQVTLTKGFYMGKYQVTQAQYEAVMESNPSGYRVGGIRASDLGGITDTTNFPVERVSWYDALVFCNKLSMEEGLNPAYRIPGYNNSTDPEDWGTVPTSSNATWNAVQIVEGSNGYRLPTEAQWEYACRAGTTTAYNWGTDIIDQTRANYNENLDRTTAVGNYAPNAWGLYDMHGNVGELCWDLGADYSSGAQTDPTGAGSGNSRIRRGGSYFDISKYLRSAMRDSVNPYNRSSEGGFRVVRP